MMTKAVDDLSNELSTVIQNEVAKVAKARAVDTPVLASLVTGDVARADVTRDKAPRLPRRIEGGFRGLNDAIDHRSREWRAIVRTLNHQRMQVEAAEAERDRLNKIFDRIAPEVQETNRSLCALLETTKDGDISGDLSAQFAANERVLSDLEALAEALSTNLLGLRSTWEQYARTVIRAQKMREDANIGSHEPHANA